MAKANTPRKCKICGFNFFSERKNQDVCEECIDSMEEYSASMRGNGLREHPDDRWKRRQRELKESL